MKEIELVVQNKTGLHARPAREFVNIAKQFQSDIRVHHGPKKANAKSMISILTLGVERGGAIRIEVSGEDEDLALRTLVEAVTNGLGEGPAEGEESPKPEPPPAEAPAPQEPAPDADSIMGIPAAPGIAIGPIHQLTRSEIIVEETFAGSSEEQTRLQEAIEQARGQLATLRKRMLAQSSASEAAIFDVHLEILEDPDLLEPVLAKINDTQSAARAWQTTIDDRAKLVAQLDDPLLAARSADIHDVGYRVLRLLVGADEQGTTRLPDYPVIVVADDLSPSDTASLDRERVLGFCTSAGGPTAHSAIIARALSLPAIVSAGPAVLKLANQTQVILDGDTGSLFVDPDPEAVARAMEAQQQTQARRAEAAQTAAQPAISQDGHRVEVVANIGGVADAEQAQASGAEGVGLLRTEFLFLDRTDPPSEEEQFEVYRDIAQALQGQPVIVRTLDIGGDKPLSYIDVAPEQNPFLGERGIRLCLARPRLLRQQLRAILRAAEYGKLRIMFPMVADLSEWRAARAMVEQVRAELDAPAVEVGIMVEIPAAALMADAFAREVDFFSIGTNDLTQYTLAMDRMHPTLAGQSDGLHPAVLRLVERTVQAAHRAGKWVGVCGELGADPVAVPILIGLGVDELSVGVPAVATTKALIRSLTLAQAQQLAAQALACATAPEVREKVRQPE
jgi:phosphocarrier protein FPr